MVLFVASLVAACAGSQSALFAAAPSVPEPVHFSRDILPILSDNCFHCHGPDPKHREADLRLDDRAAAIASAAFVPGKSAASKIMQRLTSHDPDEQMPPPKSNRKVDAAQIALIQRWIDEGAPWGKHWAFEAPQRPPLPAADAKSPLAGWPRTPIDRFLLARLEKEKLRPSSEAAKATLLRRVYLDLVGLPPTPAEVNAFLLDNSPDAYERVVDRLLASPRYGERWAWEWLDAARYADTNGYQGDPERTMWPWRDWVVKALNDNMPYDKFTVEQLAGDLLPNATLEQKVATGFNRNHMFNGEGGRIAEETRVENVMDRAETVSTVWLGLTVGCARCHDHKFDPITNREYYALYAYFNTTSETGSASGGGRSGQITPIVDFASPTDLETAAAAAAKVTKIAEEVATLETTLFPREAKLPAGKSTKAAALSGNILTALNLEPAKRGADALREMAAFYKDKEPAYGKLLASQKSAVDERDQLLTRIPRVMVMDELPTPRETFMLDKGAYDKPGAKVAAGTPAVLPPLPADAPRNRLSLARWLVDRKHPLTARVTVNRIWQTFFGTGLVKTVDDFGVQGEKPSHPELLDWLAVEFMDGPNGKSPWDVKHLHRLIVTSAAYRQESKVSPAILERDPENRLLARGPRFRMPSWMLRDQALASAGLLVEKLGGPSVKPYQPAGIWEEATFGKKSYVQDKGDALYRRSLYIFWRRIVGPTSFFDVAARQTCTVKTLRTNTPLHALTTLNDPAYVEAARALAEQTLKDSAIAPNERLAAAFRRTTLRSPTPDELRILSKSLAQLRAEFAADPTAAEKLLKVGESPRDAKLDPIEHAAFATLCAMLFNLDETLTKQ
ncbi:MAG: PSD1 and planctomycete cytochrome C domain-containing protein [Planctomycetia bacterium]|nr:PSD1 and planctomycete cytochrome C domain-containing protein [Planctomycetia bacterium]